MTRTQLIVGIVACALVALTPTAASADSTVALVTFEGGNAKTVQNQVAEILERDFDVIGAARYRRQARKLKATAMNAKNVRRVAKRLKADAVITGKIQPIGKKRNKRRRYRLTVDVLSGSSGKSVASIKLVLRQRSLRLKDRRKLSRSIGNALAELDEPVAVAKDDGGGRQAPSNDDSDDDDDDAGVPTSSDDDDDDDDDDDSAVAASAGTAAALAGTGAGTAASVAVGMTLNSRSLNFNFTEIATEADPQGYSGFPFGGLVIDGEVYPMAFVNGTSALANIGVSATFERMLFIESSLENMPDVTFPTTQQRWGIGALYRWNIKSSPKLPTLKFGVALNKLSFDIDKNNAPPGLQLDVPNVGYLYIDPGVVIEYAIGSAIVVRAGGRYMALLSAGQVLDGTQYGQASARGGLFDLGLDYKLTSSIFVRGGLKLITVGLNFNGQGALTDRDNDATQDVASARDRFISGYAAAGYSF